MNTMTDKCNIGKELTFPQDHLYNQIQHLLKTSQSDAPSSV